MTLSAQEYGRRAGVYSGSHVSLALIAGAYANGYFKPVSEWLQGLKSATEFGLPISLLDVIVVAVAARQATAPQAPGLAEALSAAAVLIPSSAVSWAAACGYACWRASGERDAAKTGYALLAALAAAQLWTFVFIK